MADVLTISPALMEGYIRAAGRISREAVGDADRAGAHANLSDFARAEARCAILKERRLERAAGSR